MTKQRIIIDAENAVLGRLASFTAKQALLGKEVIIVNAEKTIVVGNKKNIIQIYESKRKLGGPSLHGPFFPTLSEKILKRTIRGMLNYKEGKGKEAFKRIKTYRGVPLELKEENKIKSGKGKKGISLEEISRLLRGGI